MNAGDRSTNLDPFFEVLRANKFVVGLDHRLRVLKALEKWEGDFHPCRFRSLLCPIFATSRDEQQLFYHLFENHWPHFVSASSIDRTGVVSVTSTGDSGSAVRGTVIASYIRFLLTGVAIVMIAILANHGVVQRPAGTPPPTPLTNLSPGVPITPKETVIQPQAQARKTWGWWALLPALAWACTETWAWHRRRVILSRVPDPVLPSTVERKTIEILPVSFRDLTSSLSRLRTPSASPLGLHLGKTVSATVRAIGFPTLCYQAVSRRPQYLVLIDRSSARDHQAMLFEDLVRSLERSGLRVTAYVFSGDPRVCRSITSGRSVYLADLQRRMADHRLLIFSGADRLVSRSGDLKPGARLLLAWRQRSVLTPRMPGEWGSHEYHLANSFLLLPATLSSLEAFVDYFDPDRSARLRTPQSTFNHRDPYFERITPAEIRQALQDRDLFNWLCACALYPQLQWNITLQLGYRLDPTLLSEARIIKLVRLPWLRLGSIPVALQQKLAESLGRKLRHRARRALVEILTQLEARRVNAGKSSLQLEIAVQKLDLMPEERRRILDDDALARVVEHGVSRLATVVPQTLLRILFPFGIPSMGFRARVRRTLIFLVLMGFVESFVGAQLASLYSPPLLSLPKHTVGVPADALSKPKPPIAGLALEGLYRGDREFDNSGNPSWPYLRFFRDGTVLAVASTGVPDQVGRWLQESYPNALSSSYSFDGLNLKFSLMSPAAGEVAYTGKTSGSTLVFDLRTKSLPSRRRTYQLALTATALDALKKTTPSHREVVGVVHAGDGAPVAGVQVVLRDIGSAVTTDSGQFTIAFPQNLILVSAPIVSPIEVRGQDIVLVSPASHQVTLRNDNAPLDVVVSRPTKSGGIFNNWNTAAVANNPVSPTTFTIKEPYLITGIANYHWNNGRGASPEGQSIGLRDSHGRTFGPWPVAGMPGQNGAMNVDWESTPNAKIPPGTYEVVDSNRASWSYNAQSGNAGFSQIKGQIMAGDTPQPQTANPVPNQLQNQQQLEKPGQATATESQDTVPSATHSVTLTWKASKEEPGQRIVGYNVYRSTRRGGPYSKIASMIVGTSYVDSTVESGSTYYYVTTAVDAAGHESSYSTEAQGTIPK